MHEQQAILRAKRKIKAFAAAGEGASPSGLKRAFGLSPKCTKVKTEELNGTTSEMLMMATKWQCPPGVFR